jgi:hypothetical protein
MTTIEKKDPVERMLSRLRGILTRFPAASFCIIGLFLYFGFLIQSTNTFFHTFRELGGIGIGLILVLH